MLVCFLAEISQEFIYMINGFQLHKQCFVNMDHIHREIHIVRLRHLKPDTALVSIPTRAPDFPFCLHILSFKRLLELELIKRQSDLNTELEVRGSSWNANECDIRF